MIREVRAERDQIDNLFKKVRPELEKVDLIIQPLIAGNMIIRSAGFVERSVKHILFHYAKDRSNREIASFISKSIDRENSLNCEKIERILNRFDDRWWPAIREGTTYSSRSSIDSLKDLRDTIAHGGSNGTGLATVQSYFNGATQVIQKMTEEILKP